jgi:outer membrane biosynthesis protein TonB
MKPMRDARLKRALDCAPDEDQRPASRTRDAVLAAARRAVEPAPRSAWWTTWWRASGSQRMPWNAAFATVLVATLVTVLWHDREVPDARTEAPAATEAVPPQAKASVTAAVPAAPPVPTTSSQPVSPSRSPARTEKQARPAAPVPAPVQAPAEQAAPSAAKPEAADELRAQAQRQAESAVGTAMRDRADASLAKSAPPAEPSAAGVAAPAMSPRAALAADDWTSLRITAQGRTVSVARVQAGGLDRLLDRLRKEAWSTGPFDAAPAVRIELMRSDVLVASIEMAAARVRWTRWREGQAMASVASPDAATLRELQDEVERLLPR